MTTTRPTHASRSRWAAPASFAVLGALGATILGACTPNTGLDMSKPLSDGTWTAQSNPDDQGSIGTITITVEGGHITATSYETTLADGTDKVEIIRMAREIGTYETSILPYEDCCTVFTPRHPATRPVLEDVVKAESVLDIDGLVAKALEGETWVRVKPQQ